MLAAKGRTLDCVIEIEVDEVALLARIETAHPSADAQAQLGVMTAPKYCAEDLLFIVRVRRLCCLIRAKGLLKSVDGMVSIERVATQIDNLLR